MSVFGGLRKYFFIGHLESYNDIEGMFKEAKKECLKQSKRYKVTKKSINETKWGYLDFEFFETILGWMNTQKETELGAISFFKKLEDFIEDKQIIFAKETKEFIEGLEKEIQKIKETKINIDSYREIGKEVFIKNKSLK